MRVLPVLAGAALLAVACSQARAPAPSSSVASYDSAAPDTMRERAVFAAG